MNRYETMFIVKPALSNEELEQVFNQINQEISKLNGKIYNQRILGKKTLSYEIKRQKEGLYVLYYFEMNSTDVKKLERRLMMNQNIIRFLMIRFEGENFEKESLSDTEEYIKKPVVADSSNEETVADEEPKAEDTSVDEEPKAEDTSADEEPKAEDTSVDEEVSEDKKQPESTESLEKPALEVEIQDTDDIKKTTSE